MSVSTHVSRIMGTAATTLLYLAGRNHGNVLFSLHVPFHVLWGSAPTGPTIKQTRKKKPSFRAGRSQRQACLPRREPRGGLTRLDPDSEYLTLGTCIKSLTITALHIEYIKSTYGAEQLRTLSPASTPDSAAQHLLTDETIAERTSLPSNMPSAGL